MTRGGARPNSGGARPNTGGARAGAGRPRRNNRGHRRGVGRMRRQREDALSEPDAACAREDCCNILEGLAVNIQIGESHSSELPYPLPVTPQNPPPLPQPLLSLIAARTEPQLSVSSVALRSRVPDPPSLRPPCGASHAREDRGQ